MKHVRCCVRLFRRECYEKPTPHVSRRRNHVTPRPSWRSFVAETTPEMSAGRTRMLLRVVLKLGRKGGRGTWQMSIMSLCSLCT